VYTRELLKTCPAELRSKRKYGVSLEKDIAGIEHYLGGGPDPEDELLARIKEVRDGAEGARVPAPLPARLLILHPLRPRRDRVTQFQAGKAGTVSVRQPLSDFERLENMIKSKYAVATKRRAEEQGLSPEELEELRMKRASTFAWIRRPVERNYTDAHREEASKIAKAAAATKAKAKAVGLTAGELEPPASSRLEPAPAACEPESALVRVMFSRDPIVVAACSSCARASCLQIAPHTFARTPALACGSRGTSPATSPSSKAGPIPTSR
jgi:hypothetical protein